MSRRQKSQPLPPFSPKTETRRRVAFICVVLFVILVAGLYLFLPRTKPATQVVYADEVKCVGCHATAAAGYARTGMAHSFSTPGPEDKALATRAPFFHQPSQTFYGFSATDGQLSQHRAETGPGGQPVNAEELRIDYVMGSGNHARTYLHRDPDGTLLELPLAWYAENGGELAMNPGFDNPHPPTRRVITYECMFCHNGYPDIPDPAHADTQATPVYLGKLPEGITCQRCHGPGQQHVQAAQTPGKSLDAIRAAILNPARLEPSRQMQVCEQCHLQITSQPLPDRIRHFDSGPFSYQAGQPLSGSIDYFTRDPAIAPPSNFEIVSAPYRLRQSRCFRESGGALTCNTCHNPHNLQKGPAAADYFARVCLTCHRAAITAQVAAGKHPGGTECVSCHMPVRRTEDVVHVTMHDHLIQRRTPPKAQLVKALAEEEPTSTTVYRGEVIPYAGHFDSTRPQAALYRAAAQVLQDSNTGTGMERLEQLLRANAPAQPQFALALGDAHNRRGEGEAAIAAYRQALAADPLSEPAARSLAVALAAAGQTGEALQRLEAALARNPGASLLWYEKGRIEQQAGKTREGQADLRHCLSLKPGFAQAGNALGLSLAESGSFDEAEAAFRGSLAANPFDLSTQTNLGNVLASRGNVQQALLYLERAARLAPANAAGHLAYAAALAQTNDLRGALAQSTLAVTLEPNSCPALTQSGELLAQMSQFPQAGERFTSCIAHSPRDPRANLDLALLRIAGGQGNAALGPLRIAAAGRDLQVAERSRALLQQFEVR